MSSLHHVAPAAHRAGNASAVASADPAHQFQSDPVTVRRLLSSIGAQLGTAWRLICVWKQRHRDRAVLRSLSPRDIRDFCPREADAEEEMSKPFWRA